MIHYKWKDRKVIKRVKCLHTNAAKYKVDSMLTVGKYYDVINETDEFIFIIDDSDRVAGYFKEYFEEVDSAS